MRYFLKYSSRRRRYCLVKRFGLTDPTRRDMEFTIDATLAASWPTRAEAESALAQVRTAFEWSGRRRSRYTVVREDWQTPVASTRRYKPRHVITPTAYQSVLLENAVAVCYARAAAAGLQMPKLDALALFVTRETSRASRGGRHRGGLYFISITANHFTDTERPGYLQYIVAHELAHVADVLKNGSTSHGPRFMACLKVLCPPDVIAYELTYKPAQARAAGITLATAAPAVAAHVGKVRERRSARPLSELLGAVFIG